MFEEYLQDARHFYDLAESTAPDREAKMFYRASVFCACAAVESFVNFVGDTLSKNEKLDKNEIAFLNDRILDVVPAKGTVEEKQKFQAIDGKIKFIISRFGVEIDTAKSTEWSNFFALKELRDNLVHPREMQDSRDKVYYSIKIKKGLNANITLMTTISNKLFKKHLRKKLLDLKI